MRDLDGRSSVWEAKRDYQSLWDQLDAWPGLDDDEEEPDAPNAVAEAEAEAEEKDDEPTIIAEEEPER